MCYFLTIAIPAEVVPEVPSEFRRKIYFAEQTNRSVTEHLPDAWTSFTVTSGGCSCDLYRAFDNAHEDRSKLEARYRKKGWTEAKIQRSIENKIAGLREATGLRDDIRELVTTLTCSFGEVRLFLHWYSGELENEKFNLKDAGCVFLEEFIRDSTAFRDETTLIIKTDPQNHSQ